jgi:NAD(P)-dependent dehydrogenase (short-subunit alcohol dehydrogenase family)
MKNWFVTGTSKGLGRAFAEAALARGDRVAATARDTVSLQPLVDQFGDAVLPIGLDVTDRTACTAAMDRAAEAFGSLDVVVNNAGVGVIGAVEETSEDEARAIFDTNFFGALWVTQAALPYLRGQRSGHVVQVSSIGGLVAFPMVGFYNASKWALEAMSDALAQEVAEFGIRVTLIEPGPMRTEWANTSMPLVSNPDAAYVTALEARLGMMTNERTLRQPGDPRRAAEALLDVVDSDDPPLRLVMGNGALDLAYQRYQERAAEWASWEKVSRGTDFPSGE